MTVRSAIVLLSAVGMPANPRLVLRSTQTFAHDTAL